MPSTTFNLKLDPAIKPADYSYVYFVAFDQGGNAVPINGQSGPNANVIKLIDQGTIQPITTATINQGANQTGYYPSNYDVVMQHPLAWASDLSSLLSEKANITTDNAVSSHFNFTMVEAVLTPSVYDQIDISALNNFGTNTNVISMSYSDLQNAIYAPTFGNDANGFAKSYLVSGFDAGLWGANATYTNPNTTHTAVNATTGPATIDLSNSWNWSQLYNYDGATAKAQGVTVVDIGTGGEKLALTPGLASTYNPLSYFDYNDLKTGVFYQMLLDQPKPAPH